MTNNYLFIFLLLNLFDIYIFETIIQSNNINLKLKLNNNTITTNINNEIKRNKKSKFCYIKCNCFPSHTTINDNINVPGWKGLYRNNV